MRKWIATAIVGAVCAACGGGTDQGHGHLSSTSSPPCATRDATYRAHFVEEVGGTCGAVPDTIGTPNGLSGPSSSSVTCSRKDSVSDNNCVVTLDDECISRGYVIDMAGVVYWSEDGSRGEAELHVELDGSCSSIYAVTWTRQ